jgi:hypothetical protein
MRLKIIFQDVTEAAKAAGYDFHAPLLAFVEVEDENGKSIRVGDWSTDGPGGFAVLTIPTTAHMPPHSIDERAN